MDVLYLDNHLLAINKPAGVLTQPSDAVSDSLQTRGQEWLKRNFQKPGRVFLQAVHRIDKPVSGVVLFARTSKSIERCMAAVRERKNRKFYLALVACKPCQEKGLLRHFLIKGNHRASIVDEKTMGAKECLLEYELLKQGKGLYLLKIELHTGRYHQIRSQLAAAGMPLLGDGKYGSRKIFFPGAIALHHAHMDFPHPVTRQMLRLSAPLPDYWPLQAPL